MAGWLFPYGYRVKLTIDDTNVDSNLTDFPVRIQLSSSTGQGADDVTPIFDQLGANDQKIAVTTSDGLTQCYVEVERWDDTAEEAVLWVKVPSILASGGATIYLYYDSSVTDNTTYVDVTGSTVAQNVWDSDFALVYHMNQDPSGGASCILDSTSNNNDGTPAGTMLTEDLVAGPDSGKAIDFEGNDDEINFAMISSATMTIELQIKVDAESGVWDMFCGTDGATTDFFGNYQSGTYLRIRANNVDANVAYDLTGDVGSWINLTAILDGTNWTLMVDGAVINSAGMTQVMDVDTLMYGFTTTSYHVDGKVAEFRISDTNRAQAWVKATHYSNTDNFVTFGTLEGWLGTYQHRIKLTVDDTNVDSDLTNFPVLVKLSTASGIGDVDVSAVFDELTSDANRKKIAVTTSDGTTECYVEIERWDDANEVAYLWVKVPSILASGGAVLYLYYDSTASDNTSKIGDIGDAAAQSVWDSNFVFVCHMAQDPDTGGAGDIKDSTSNANNGTAVASMTSADLVDSAIDKGIDFDGSDDWIDFGTPSELNLYGDYTIEAIIEAHSSGNAERIMGRYDDGQNQSFMLGKNSSNYLNCAHLINSSTYNVILSTATHTSGYKSQVATFEEGVGSELFVDGVSQGTDSTVTTALSSITLNFLIGAQDWASARRPFLGEIDEVRVSNILRTDAWIKATHYSNTDAIVTFTGQETLGWLRSWSNRIKITLAPDNVDSTQTNIPVLIYLSTASGIGDVDVSAVFDELTSDANRQKIAITKADGFTQQYVEIEKWDDANEVAWLWTKVPSLDATNSTVLYLYYDSAQSSNTDYIGDIGDAVAQNVWDSNFDIVCHMVDATTSTLKNSVDGSTFTKAGAGEPAEATGAIAKGQDFDGSNDRVPLGTIAAMATFSVEFIGNHDADANCCAITKYSNDASAYADWIILGNLDQKLSFITWQGGYEDLVSTNTYSIGNDFHGSFTFDTDDKKRIYLAGALETTSADKGGDVDTHSQPVYAGVHTYGGTPVYFPGIIDELRISDIARSANWIKACYYSNTDALAAFGSEELYGIGGETTTVALAEALGMTLAFDTGLSPKHIINLSAPLVMTAELITTKVGFKVTAPSYFNYTLAFDAGLSVALVGRDLWEFNSYITKILERDSDIEKITSKDSRITKLFDRDSSVR